MPRGVGAIRLLFIVGGLLAFAGLYGYFIWEIWTTDAKEPPKLDKQLVYIASALGGILGTFFAVAMGIQRRDPKINQRELRLGSTLVGEAQGPGVALGTAALWIFFGVGLAAGITALMRTVQSPDSIKALAATFGGYGLSIIGAAFGGQSPAPEPVRERAQPPEPAEPPVPAPDPPA